MPMPPHVLLTAGPTREYLDAVRYLSNRSSGRMGVALARAFAAQGCRVSLVAGPCEVALPDPSYEAGIVELVSVTSAAEMYEAVAARFADCDIFVAAAAVADYRPAERLAGKHKKETADDEAGWKIDLVPNPDILYEMSRRQRDGQTLVGFALEAQDALANAQEKLERKNLEWIVLNSPANFGNAADSLTLLRRGEPQTEIIDETSKEAAATTLVARILEARQS